MSFAKALRCRECQRETPLEAEYVCDFCFGPLEVAYDYDKMREAVSKDSIEAGPASIWRYADLLPCDPDTRVDIQAGYTPLIRAKNLGKELGPPTPPVQGWTRSSSSRRTSSRARSPARRSTTRRSSRSTATTTT
jgi:hypothetical protein